MDKAVARQVDAVHPVPRHTEEPYNENKPIDPVAQLSTINSYFSSWFKGTSEAPADTASAAATVNNGSSRDGANSSGLLRSTSNEKTAADIIAASHANRKDGPKSD